MATVSLVTGGSRGIGREVCRQLAALGHTVLRTARSAGSAKAAAQAVGAGPLRLGSSCRCLAAARSRTARPAWCGP